MTLSRFLDPKNDVAFKKIFGSEKNKDILIYFLNDILELESEIIEVEFLSTVQDADIASKKQSLVDVLCRDKAGVQYIVEMQVAPTPGFEKRAQYYAAKAYSRQTNRGSGEDGKYENLKEVIFIAITDCIVFPRKKEYISRHIILDKETYEHDLKDFYFTFIELPKFKKERVEELENIIEKWCYFFKYAASTPLKDYEHISKEAGIKRAYEALDQFNWTEKELIDYEQEIKRIWDNKAVERYKTQQFEAKMKEAEAEIAQMRAQIKQSEAKGKAEGIAEGEAKGEAKEKIAIASKLLTLGLSLEDISNSTGLTLEEIKKLRNDK